MIRNENDNYGDYDVPFEAKADERVEGGYQEPEYMSLQVTDPTNITQAGKNLYTTYLITVQTTYPQYKGKEFTVRRRYKEFANLRKMLVKYAEDSPKSGKKGGSIAPLPAGTSFLFGPDRFNADFIEQRRKGLQAFLESVTNHVICRFCPALISFLQDETFQS